MVQKYQKGEHVCYGVNGVCLIEDIREIAVAKNKETFYVLRPLRDRHSIYYIPVRNTALTEKIRELIPRDEIDAMLEAVRTDSGEWIEDRKLRMEAFHEILRIADPRALLQLCTLLYQKKQALSDSGKKLCPSDETILKQAEDLTENEFGLVLGIPAKDVRQYIINRLITK